LLPDDESRLAPGKVILSTTIDRQGGRHNMPMKYPSHRGELVRANLDELGLSVAEAATGLGITR